jgi:predicted RNase H-like HicB family nuclease
MGMANFGQPRALRENITMRTLKFTYWQDGEYYLGYLNDFPDYETQGFSKEELEHNLRSLLDDVESGEVPFVKTVEDLVVA